MESFKFSRGQLFGIIGFSVLGFSLYSSIYSVKAAHRAVVYSRIFGVKDAVYGEGVHFKIPFIETPTFYSIRNEVMKYPTESPSKDLQMVSISIRVLLKPMPHELPNIHRTLGPEFIDRVFKSMGPEILKATVAEFNAYELINKRETVSQLIKKRMIERARSFFIEIDDVSITELNFGSEYLAAVEAKQVAQQDAEKAKFVVERAKQTKLEIIVKARGEAIASLMFNEQLRQDPEGNFLALKKIEAAKDIAEIISKSSNTVYLNSDNLMFNILGSIGEKSKVAEN